MRTLVCSGCGYTNTAQANFCSGCGTPLRTDSGQLTPGDTLQPDGRYRIVRLLDFGGMAALYEAEDTHLNTRVAVKELRSSDPQTKDQDLKLFQAEARVLKDLRHTGVPQIFDFFQERGRFYIVMEYVEGDNLEGRLAEQRAKQHGPFPEETVREWAKQVLDTLEYLHSRTPQVIHRDIKPANLVWDERHKRLVLVDFGIARTYKSGKSCDTTHLGTEGYAPPEQYGRKQTTERSDLYSLGATMHYLLTGQEPFRRRHVFQFKSVRELRPELSEDIAQLVGKAVNLTPADRYASAAEMREALLRNRRPRRRTRQLPLGQAGARVAVAVSLAAVAVVGVVGGSRFWHGSFDPAQVRTALDTALEQVTTPSRAKGPMPDLSQVRRPAMARADAGHTGAFPDGPANPRNLRPNLLFDTGAALVGSPVVAGGVLLACTSEGRLYAIDALDGGSYWHSLVECASAPALVDGELHLFTRSGNLIALDQQGQLLRTYDQKLVPGSVLSVFQGSLLVVDPIGRLHGVSPRSYLDRFTRWMNISLRSTPTAGDEQVFVVARDTIHGLDLRTIGEEEGGVISRSEALQREVIGDPAYGQGMLFVSTTDGHLYALTTPAQGLARNQISRRAEFHQPGSTFTAPTLWSDLVFVGSSDGKVYALPQRSSRDMAQLWSYATDGAIVAAPVVSRGVLYLATTTGSVYALDVAQGFPQELYSHKLDGAVTSGLYLWGSRLYVALHDGRIYAFQE